MALYGSLLEALDAIHGTDVMRALYQTGKAQGISGNREWARFYNLVAEKTPNLIEWTTRSGKSTGLWSVQETSTVSTELSNISSGLTERVTINAAYGMEETTAAGEQILSLSNVGNTGGAGSSLGAVGDFLVGEALPAVAAVGIGATIGLAFDIGIYATNPDYWDEHLPTLNPETWDDIILGHDTKIPILHNTRDGKSYISEDMLTYVAMLGESDGWYKIDYYTETSDLTADFAKYNVVSYGKTTVNIIYTDPRTRIEYPAIVTTDKGEFIVTKQSYSTNTMIGWYTTEYTSPSDLPKYEFYVPELGLSEHYDFKTKAYRPVERTYDDKSIWYWNNIFGWSYFTGKKDIEPRTNKTDGGDPDPGIVAWIAAYGNRVSHGGKKGINKIGVTPDLTGITTLDGAKQKLRDTYPSLFNNKVSVPYYDPESDTVKNNDFIPFPFPANYEDYDGKPNNKPITDGYNQTDDGSYPNDDTKNKALEDSVAPTIESTPSTNIDPNIPPNNPLVEPETPIPIIPDVPTSTGMGAVYVPTIEQVRNFSSWLWSDSFIDQIKKLFSDPMQGIVGLHQVYFSPSHDGATTIHCGYLDSNVPSDYTTNRYYTLDCGSISVSEIYGNVFDYDPYTNIELYLPFIGIVPLNTGDVMRGTLNVKYICDVLTGACLANIYVQRDGSNNILYTYGGNCAVQYPLSSGSYMGIITALAGAGVSIGTAIATGGMSIPLSIAGGAAAVMNGKTNVATSGGYGGNTGAMGVKKPYVIIKTTRTAMPNNYQKFTGQPYNNVIKLSNCRGFTQANILHLDADYNITQAEADEIATYLSQGVII